MFPQKQLFHIDNLSLVMMGLVGFVAMSIASFSFRYLKGDRKQLSFYINLVTMTFSIFLMVGSDHIILFITSWLISNIFLTRLIRHKSKWEATRQSSILTIKYFGLGFIFFGSALFMLYRVTGETSIQAILNHPINTTYVISVGLLMLLTAMTQSALWPFHAWLTSSLNSPTPVSAIMHAGLVNGGGFLLARFAPMLSESPVILDIIFIIGITTAFIGTLWKLIQNDVKRMLACSTMGQMGFMVAQCGLGLFPAAVTHLCWHGLFKAYLFLASGSAAKEKQLDLGYPPSLKQFSLAIILGAISAYMFSLTSSKNILAGDTNLFIILLTMIAGTQFALSIIHSNSTAKLLIALFATIFMGSLYGLSINLVDRALAPSIISTPQPINIFHLLAFAILTIAWLIILFARHQKHKQYPDWMLKTYVYMLNASQPHPKTTTPHRNQYQL